MSGKLWFLFQLMKLYSNKWMVYLKFDSFQPLMKKNSLKDFTIYTRLTSVPCNMFLTHVHITCNCPLTKILYKNRLFCIVQREIILSRLCCDTHENIESVLVISSSNSSFAMRKIVRIDAFYMNTYSRHWRFKQKDFFFKFKFIHYYFQKKLHS